MEINGKDYNVLKEEKSQNYPMRSRSNTPLLAPPPITKKICMYLIQMYHAIHGFIS